MCNDNIKLVLSGHIDKYLVNFFLDPGQVREDPNKTGGINYWVVGGIVAAVFLMLCLMYVHQSLPDTFVFMVLLIDNFLHWDFVCLPLMKNTLQVA